MTLITLIITGVYGALLFGVGLVFVYRHRTANSKSDSHTTAKATGQHTNSRRGKGRRAEDQREVAMSLNPTT